MISLAKVQETVTQGNKELLWMLSDENPTIYTKADVVDKASEILRDTLEATKETVGEIEQMKREQ